MPRSSVRSVAVAIVGYRDVADIRACLAALERQTFTAFEVIVCENGGPQACRNLFAELPDALAGGQSVRLICATANLGYAGGVNLGILAAGDADAFWVLNPDTEPEPAALAALVERLEAGDCDMAGAVLVDAEDRVLAAGYTYSFWTGFARSLANGAPAGAPIDQAQVERRMAFISGACMLVSRRVLETIGPMREDYFLYCEETEWCLRARMKGLRLGLAAGARVRHAQGATTGAIADFARRPRLPMFLGERNSVLMIRDLRPGLFPIAAISQILFTTARLGRRRAWPQIGYCLEGWWHGILGRRGLPPAPAR